MKRLLIGTMVVAGMSLPASIALGEVVVVVHKSNTSALTKDDIRAIYLGKKKRFDNGRSVTAFDLDDASNGYSKFYDAYTGKSPSQVKAYWSRLIFTGKATPPKALDQTAVVRSVARNRGGIGYVDSKYVTDDVRVIR